MAELSVKVPIKFSEKAQRDLYETCMAYKELAEMRGAENERLRELVRMQNECITSNCEWCKHRKNSESLDIECELDDLARELGVEVDW